MPAYLGAKADQEGFGEIPYLPGHAYHVWKLPILKAVKLSQQQHAYAVQGGVGQVLGERDIC